MREVQCVNCKEMVQVNEVKIGTNAVCKCGCQMKCIDADEYISRWRVINPFDFEDRRK